ncbi:hypothetical protein M514_06564, partial [Trichuris suis]
MSELEPFSLHANETIEKGYVLRPKYENKFTLHKVQPLLRDALIDELSNVKIYNPEKADDLAMSVMKAVRKRLKESTMKDYKFIVQCVVFERCGQGVEYAIVTLQYKWDSLVFSKFVDTMPAFYGTRTLMVARGKFSTAIPLSVLSPHSAFSTIKSLSLLAYFIQKWNREIFL